MEAVLVGDYGDPWGAGGHVLKLIGVELRLLQLCFREHTRFAEFLLRRRAALKTVHVSENAKNAQSSQ